MNGIVVIPNRYLFNFDSCHGHISRFFLPEDCDVNCAAASKGRSKQEIKQLTNESTLMQTKTDNRVWFVPVGSGLQFIL